MSLINGLSGLGAGLTAFAGSAAKDVEAQAQAQERAQARVSLLNSAPPAVAAPAAAAPAGTSSAPDAAAAPAGAPGRGIASVPPSLLPIYEAAAKRTGIPIEVLIAQGKQESNFNPDAIGSAGEIGIHQIKPSTAQDPGYGVKPVDPAMLKDPVVSINFAADYLRAKAGNPNFADPKAVDAALARYNGGGDRNYVANVRQHIGAG